MSFKAEEPVTPVCGRFTPTSENHPPFKRIGPLGIETLAARYDRAESTAFLDQHPVQL